MNTKIILLGYMGAGKSTIGKVLSDNIGIPFVDLDTFIEEKEQKSISEIFKIHGNIYFRKKERAYLEQILNQEKDIILATGGGTPCFGDNISLIKAHSSNVFYIHLSTKTLVKRLKNQKEKRPLIAHLSTDEALEEFINKHLFERNPYYLQANQVIKSDPLSVSEIVEKIQQTLTL